MAINKVVYGTKVLVDLSDSTVTPTTLLEGTIAYDATGERITGTASAGTDFTITVNVDSGATVTATKGDLSVSGTSVNGVCVLTVPEAGIWSIFAELNGDISSTVQIEVKVAYDTTLLVKLVNYTGTMSYEDDTTTGYRYYTLTSSGVLTLTKSVPLDYWICGGGGNGAAWMDSSWGQRDSGGGGGGGGYFATGSVSTETSFTVTIGSAGGNTSFGYNGNTTTANSGGNGTKGESGSDPDAGSGGDGGSGGGGGGMYSKDYGIGGGGTGVSSKSNPQSTLPFKDAHFTAYPCAGGAGGCANAGNGTTKYGIGGKGGTNGGGGSSGSKGSSTSAHAVAAVTGGGCFDNINATYYGSGGAGGSGGTTTTSGGKGYQGVCFLRIPLSEFGL